MRYKKYIKYLGVLFLLVWLIQVYLVQQFFSLASSPASSTTLNNETLKMFTNALNIIAFIEISLIVALVILLIPRINCLFLKIDGTKKDIILYKSIHKDEVALIANEINTRIKERNFSSFPY